MTHVDSPLPSCLIDICILFSYFSNGFQLSAESRNNSANSPVEKMRIMESICHIIGSFISSDKSVQNTFPSSEERKFPEY